MPPALASFDDAWREAGRIVLLLRSCGVPFYLFGSLGVWSLAGELQSWFGLHRRAPGDIDGITLRGCRRRLRECLEADGYILDRRLAVTSEAKVYLFRKPAQLEVEVRFDSLEFCHDIDLRRRLTGDLFTIQLADLLLSKLEIVELTERDGLDLIVLLNAAECLTEADPRWNSELDRITSLLARDWGAWLTVMGNLHGIEALLKPLDLAAHVKTQVLDSASHLRSRLESSRKSIIWHLRGLIGTRCRWYRTVSDRESAF
jgi:hypothetical protein